MIYDPTYILVLIGALISMIASWNVNRTFDRYSQLRSARNMTGRDAAEAVLRAAGITDVRIERVAGSLTDHYDPTKKVLRLSESVYDDTSVAAIGVAAHECGHAIQHQEGFLPLKLRSIAVPAAQFGSALSWPLVLLGLLLGFAGLAQAGVILFTAVVAFQLITLPVEYNASGRALAVLQDRGILWEEELHGAARVLRAAALTYVAALAASILQLLRLLILTGDRRDRRR